MLFFSNESVISSPVQVRQGEMSERPKELDWKSSIGVKAYQGFESLSLRHYFYFPFIEVFVWESRLLAIDSFLI